MEKLLEKARDAMKNSYSPYSNFKVGAAALMNDGTYIVGTNIENASFGLTNCAERTCIFTAYAMGYRKEDIKAFAVCAKTKNPISPCGACRQVLNELLLPTTVIYLTNEEGLIKQTTIKELLPYSFDEVE